MTAFGYSRTFQRVARKVRFTPETRHSESECPLSLGLRLLTAQERMFGECGRDVPF